MKGSLLKSLRRDMQSKTPACLVTNLESGQQLLIHPNELEGDLELSDALLEEARQALSKGKSGLLSDERHFAECLLPPARLMVVGAVHIAQKLCPMADQLGYEVTLIDPRQAWGTQSRFPGLDILHSWPDEALKGLDLDSRSAVITLTHDPKLDDPALLIALESPAFYIGALGSNRTHQKRLQRLSEAGRGPDSLARIYGPIGLSIGAQNPAEIAVSILAELTAVLRGAEIPGKVGRHG
ncbi:MAG: XdhC family protein [Pseudomonadota bacterium]